MKAAAKARLENQPGAAERAAEEGQVKAESDLEAARPYSLRLGRREAAQKKVVLR